MSLSDLQINDRINHASRVIEHLQKDYIDLMFPKDFLYEKEALSYIKDIFTDGVNSLVDSTSNMTDKEYDQLMQYIQEENESIICNLKDSIQNSDGITFQYTKTRSKFYDNEGFFKSLMFSDSEADEKWSGFDIASAITALILFSVILTLLVSIIAFSVGIGFAAIPVVLLAAFIFIGVANSLTNNIEAYNKDTSKTHLSTREYNNATKELNLAREQLISNAIPKIVKNGRNEEATSDKKTPAIIVTRDHENKSTFTRVSMFKDKYFNTGEANTIQELYNLYPQKA